MSTTTREDSIARNASDFSGDADLYVRHLETPTTTAFDCRPYSAGNEETCTFTAAAAGSWYAMVRALGQQLDYFLDVPDGASNPRFDITAASGDADLYVRQGT